MTRGGHERRLASPAEQRRGPEGRGADRRQRVERSANSVWSSATISVRPSTASARGLAASPVVAS